MGEGEGRGAVGFLVFFFFFLCFFEVNSPPTVFRLKLISKSTMTSNQETTSRTQKHQP